VTLYYVIVLNSFKFTASCENGVEVEIARIWTRNRVRFLPLTHNIKPETIRVPFPSIDRRCLLFIDMKKTDTSFAFMSQSHPPWLSVLVERQLKAENKNESWSKQK
jgi:hypothetical protein